MPIVISPRGTRARFSSARLAASLSRAYAHVHGDNLGEYRRQIQDTVQQACRSLSDRLGDGADARWTRASIADAVVAVLANDWQVQEAYQMAHPPSGRQPALSPDPVWSVVSPADVAPAKEPPMTLADALGEPAAIAAAPRRRKAPPAPPARRSDWLAFWTGLARLLPDPASAARAVSVLWQVVTDMPAVEIRQTAQAWWTWWQCRLDEALLRDPRTFCLWGAAQMRREWAAIVGQSWLSGSAMAPHERHALLALPDTAPVLQEASAKDVAIAGTAALAYRTLWLQWANAVEADQPPPALPWDWQVLAMAMDPSRDALLGWRAWRHLHVVDAAWCLPDLSWCDGAGAPSPEARELPQWVWMRLAMTLARQSDRPTATAIRYYELFSSLSLLPSDAILRQAARRNATRLDDQAALVPDSFEAIQQALHAAAVGTKWSGTMTLDWRLVRARGSLVAGRRVSQGIEGFLRTIQANLAAQGRTPGERPVTAIVPMWHAEVPALLDTMPEMPHVQMVLSVPDIFIEHCRSTASWWLFDPVSPPTSDDLAATARPAAAVGATPAAGLWRRIVRAMASGTVNLLFEGALLESRPPRLGMLCVPGRDGVGTFPLPPSATSGDLQTIAWPSAALNLARVIDASGSVDLHSLSATVTAAMQMLDAAVNLAPPSSLARIMRPVCLGVVGIDEAVSRLGAQSMAPAQDQSLHLAWTQTLAEILASMVARADAATARTAGPLPLVDGCPPTQSVFDPTVVTAARPGVLRTEPAPRQDWKRLVADAAAAGGQRFSVRMAWAPFAGAAALCATTPGGVGGVDMVERVVDEAGRQRLVPSPWLLHMAVTMPDEAWSDVMKYPHQPRHWPPPARTAAAPDRQEWERRLRQAAAIKPWIDQGVCLTIPPGLSPDDVEFLARRAWWMGLNVVRTSSPAWSVGQQAAA